MGGARDLLLKAWKYGRSRRIFHVAVLVLISVALQVALTLANNVYTGSCSGYGCSIPCSAYGYGYGYGSGYISCYGLVGCDAYSGYGGYGYTSCDAYVNCNGYVGQDGYVGCDAYSYDGGGSVACDAYVVCDAVSCDAYTYCPPPSTSCDAYPGSCLPDLAVSGLTDLGETSSPASYQINWTVRNQGADTDNVMWADWLYLSTDEFLDGGDTRIGTSLHFGPLGSGSSYLAHSQAFLPYVPDGSYYLIVKADNDDTVAETDENNNVIATPLVIKQADLVATGISAPDVANSRDPIAISWDFANQGGTTTSAWYDGLYLSEDAALDMYADTLIDWKNHVSRVYSGDSYRNDSLVTLPEWPDGTYYLLSFADASANQLWESDESNNGFSRQITIDNTPPEFLNVVATPTCDGAVIDWETNEPATTAALDWCCDPVTGHGYFVFEGASSELSTTHQMAITGLLASYGYYFRAYSADAAGNPMSSEIGTFSVGTERPDLRLSWAAAYWQSFEDYLARRLSVDYTLTNAGANFAENIQITGSSPSPSGVQLDTALPFNLGSLAPGQTGPFTLQYMVPGGVYTIIIANEASAEDSCGNSFAYP